MEIFAHKVPEPEPRELIEHYHVSNFNSFLEAFVSVFIVLANEGWVQLYSNIYHHTSALPATFFFFILIVVG
jgi:hypothetical protein